jgi:hypothetical protein
VAFPKPIRVDVTFVRSFTMRVSNTFCVIKLDGRSTVSHVRIEIWSMYAQSHTVDLVFVVLSRVEVLFDEEAVKCGGFVTFACKVVDETFTDGGPGVFCARICGPADEAFTDGVSCVDICGPADEVVADGGVEVTDRGGDVSDGGVEEFDRGVEVLVKSASISVTKRSKGQ